MNTDDKNRQAEQESPLTLEMLENLIKQFPKPPEEPIFRSDPLLKTTKNILKQGNTYRLPPELFNALVNKLGMKGEYVIIDLDELERVLPKEETPLTNPWMSFEEAKAYWKLRHPSIF